MDFNGKRLYRKKYDRTFLGVCGGLGEYFNVDPVIFRIIFVALFLGGSVGFWLYLLMALIIPEEPDSQE
ncbi:MULTISPECIES: PspC domain-containing protein [Aerococcus]|uniref:PspC domain-containing protein n=2 Tax=Aerococcus TaxID=1375 RepID=A0ABT4BXM0_9LACT|nr:MULTISPECIES: PspC domain-containing protein [Aerococcus]AEA00949.1 PspC domain protein [Aerococcus sp. Group 1]KAA9220726.1 PspC domain-containing protein [Aerococcus loyolae]KAA9265674.1 PspC domain-containing protein [Aerococcus loyolae]MCY3025014.1 PspC domain-containing protein [Aerococcus loyolae]MCY3026930.1 PspC domain-containing protein [Aerococcus loyolae]